MHSDSIDLSGERRSVGKVSFQTFVGVAPRRFARVFRWPKRKDQQGRLLLWEEHFSQPGVDDADPQTKDIALWGVRQQLESRAVVERENAALLALSAASGTATGSGG